MTKRRKQGLCYYCDDQYSPGHKCKEPKFFQIVATQTGSDDEAQPNELLGEEVMVSQDIAGDTKIPLEEPTISLLALIGISSTNA